MIIKLYCIYNMPNRFDRRLKGSGLIPGSSSCKTKTTNIPMNKNIQKPSSNTKVTNTVSNTKVKQSNILKTGVNTMVILDNHKNSINKTAHERTDSSPATV